MNQHVQPRSENMDDAALLEGAAATLRKLSLDFEELKGKGQTVYADDAFSAVLTQIDEAVGVLASAATEANENALSDAADDVADFRYEQRMDD
jgi:hypothetical protein